MLWGMINVMQLIVKMPLLNITFPQNAATLYTFLSDLSSFDLIPTDKIDIMIFNFTDSDINDPNFQQMGIKKYNVIQNLGSTIYYLIGFFLLVVLALILRACKERFKM
jgi:hypothetical protein